VPLLFPPGSALCPASPSLQRVPWVSVPRLLGFSCFQPSVLCSAKTTASPSRVASPQARFPIPCAHPLSVRVPLRLASRVGCAQSTPGLFCIPVCLSRCRAQGDGGSLKFPDYPCVGMPRSQTPGVSSPLALALPGPQPSGWYRPSAFAGVHPLILMDHDYQYFGAQSRGLPTRYTWLHTHLHRSARRFATDSMARLLWWESDPISPHPLGSNIRFHRLPSDPKDLGFT